MTVFHVLHTIMYVRMLLICLKKQDVGDMHNKQYQVLK